MRLKHNKVNFEILYEGHQNWSKTYLMNIFGGFCHDHHMTSKICLIIFESHHFILQKFMYSPVVLLFDMFHSVNVFSKYFLWISPVCLILNTFPVLLYILWVVWYLTGIQVIVNWVISDIGGWWIKYPFMAWRVNDRPELSQIGQDLFNC